jgi:hypothetical protein
VGVALFELLSALDRWLVLRVALASGTRLGALRSYGGDGAVVQRRIAQSSRRLCVLLWAPLGALWGGYILYDATNYGASGVLGIVVVMLFELLPAASLGATVLLLWSECTAIGQLATEILDGVIATPAAERDVALTQRAVGKVQAALKEASRRWSGVLLVQLLLFASVTGGFATWVLTRSNLDAGDMVLFAAFVLPVLWPLVLSFAAVVRANALFDEIPARVTSEFLFTPAVRAPPYNR